MVLAWTFRRSSRVFLAASLRVISKATVMITSSARVAGI